MFASKTALGLRAGAVPGTTDRRKVRLGTLAMAAVVVAVVSVATSGSGAAASSGDARPSGGPSYEHTLAHPTPGHPIDVESNYTIIESELLFKHPDEWGGAYVDGNVLVVLTVSHSVGEANRILADLGVHQGVVVRTTDVSYADLDAGVAAIASEKNRPANVHVVGPDYSRSAIVAGIDDGDINTLAEVSDLPEVEGIPLIAYDADAPLTKSRYYDTSPYYGGDMTLFKNASGNWKGCSSGFPWLVGTSGYRMVSASHCYNSNNGGGNYGTTARLNSGGGNTNNGSVTWVSGDVNGTIAGRHGDLLVWTISPGSNLAKVFTGPGNAITTRTVKPIVSLPQNWKGSTLRTSGAGGYWGNGDGEIAPDWIKYVNQTFTTMAPQSQTFTNMSDAESATECVAAGDSGGALYQQNGTSGASAVGILSATNGGGGGLTNCQNWYTPLGYLTADYGGALRTG